MTVVLVLNRRVAAVLVAMTAVVVGYAGWAVPTTPAAVSTAGTPTP